MPIPLNEFMNPKQTVTLDEFMTEPAEPLPHHLTLPKGAYGRKLAKKVMKPIGKGLWTGLGILAWPFQRAESLLAGPSTAFHETGWRTPIQPLDYLGPERPTMGRREGLEHIGKAFVPPIKSLARWKMHPEAKTFGDVLSTWTGKMTGEEPKGFLKGTSIAGGIGASFLTTPSLVSGAFKGATRLGRATPWYKAYQASRLPALEGMILEHGADKAAGIIAAQKLGKTVRRKELKPIAAKLFDVAKPSKTQIGAVAKRLKQIESGGISARPELAEKAGKFSELWEKTTPVLEKAGLLGKETIFTKLSKAKKALFKNRISVLEKQVEKLREPAYQKTLTGLAKGLKVKGQRTVENQIVRLVTKLNKGSQPEKVAAERALNKLAHQLSSQNIQGQNPLINQIVKLVRKYNLSGSKDRIDIKTHLVRLAERAAKQNITGRQKIIATATKLAKDLENADAARQIAIREQLVKLGEQAQKQGVTGLQPLLKKIASMKRRFPGQSQKIKELTKKIDDIKLQIWRSEHLGGTLPSSEAVPAKYAPRMYEQYEKAGRRWPFFSKFRIRRPYAKHRKDIPLATRKEMGEITGIGYPEVKRAMQVSNDVAVADLFNKIKATPGWVDDLAEGFKKLPESKAFGVLSGRGVHPTVYNNVKMVVDVRTSPGKFADALLGTWKQFKLQSLALMGRNKVSNTVLNDITGTDPIAQARMAKRLIGEIKNNTDDWQTIQRYLLRSGFQKAELEAELLNISQGGKPTGALNAFAKVMGGVRKWTGTQAFGRAYGRVEQFDKALKYLHMREKGMVPLEAVKEANRVLFDYGALHPLEKTIARRIMPFYTFPRKAIPVVLQAMRDNPYAVAKYPVMFWGVQQYSLQKLDMTNEDYDELAGMLPEYLDRDSTLLMPWKDKDGKLELYDWTFVLPWGPMAEMNQRGPLDVILSNPLYTLLSNIQTNYNTYTGKKIYDDSIPWEDMTPEYRREQNYKKLKFAWQLSSPPYYPGGIYWNKLDAAFRDKNKSIPKALAHTMAGFRTQAVDPEETKMWYHKGKKKQMGGLSGQLRSLGIKKALGKITAEEYEQQKKILIDQMKHLSEPELLLKTTR